VPNKHVLPLSVWQNSKLTKCLSTWFHVSDNIIEYFYLHYFFLSENITLGQVCKLFMGSTIKSLIINAPVVVFTGLLKMLCNKRLVDTIRMSLLLKNYLQKHKGET
jgi:hypothetical protein